MDAHGELLHPDELLAELGWVRALARSLVLDPDVTDDVLQQVCLLALQKAPRGARTGPRLRAWLAAVTRSLARRTLRSDVRRRRRELIAAQPEALPSTAELAAHREALQGLVEAVTALQEPYFSAIIARYFEGLEIADIASRSGTTPAAVRQQLSRARSQLRGRLQQLVADDRDGWLASALALPTVGAALGPVGAPPVVTAPAGRVAADIGRFGGSLVARQAGKGVAGKLAAAFVLLFGLAVFTWRMFVVTPETGVRPAVITVPEVATGEQALPAQDIPAPRALEPTPMLAPSPAEAAPSPWSFGRTSVPAPAADSSPQTFRLVVVDREARPVAGALVETCVKTGDTLPNRPMESQQIFSAVTTAFTDSIGRCSVTLSPAEQTLMVSKERVGSSGRRNATLLERARNGDGDVVIALLPFLVIQGQVLNADGSPAVGLPVCIRPTGADPLTGGPRLVPLLTTDGGGHFQATTDHSNQYAIVTMGTGLPVQRVVNPKPGETLTVSLQLPGDWQLGGTVVDETGAVVVGARVLALHLPDDVPLEDVLFNPGPKDAAVTDAAGAFSTSLRDAGTYLVAAFAKGHPMSEPQRVRIEGTQSRHALALTLETPAAITGSVLAPGGAAAPGVSVLLEPLPPVLLGDVSLFGPYLQKSMVAKSGPDGRFAFRNLPPRGSFELRACSALRPASAPCEAPRVRAVAGATGVVLVAETGGPAASASLRVRFRSSPKSPPLANVRWSVCPEGEGKLAFVATMKLHAIPEQPLDITELDPGVKYTLAVLADGHGGVDVHDLLPTRDGTDVTVELPLPGSLVVDVVDARGAPVPFSQVEIRRSFEFLRNFLGGERMPQATGAAGSTRFTDLDPGPYHVTATSPAGKVEGDVVVGDGEDASIRLTAASR